MEYSDGRSRGYTQFTGIFVILSLRRISRRSHVIEIATRDPSQAQDDENAGELCVASTSSCAIAVGEREKAPEALRELFEFLNGFFSA